MSDSIQQDPPIVDDLKADAVRHDPPIVESTKRKRLPKPQGPVEPARAPEQGPSEPNLPAGSSQQNESQQLSQLQSHVPAASVEIENNTVPAEADALVTGTATELPGGKTAAKTESPIPARAWYQWPVWLLGRLWDLACLWILLAVVAAIPLVQLASLGYLLTAAGNLARGDGAALPGLRLAGKLGTFVLLSTMLWLPVWLVTDLSYSAQLLQPDSAVALGWRVAAFVVTGLWVVHVAWAAMRGGRWWHMLWPAPIRLLKDIWRPATWSHASDSLYQLASSLHFGKLWWLGARAAAAAVLCITIPVSLMIIGLRSYELGPAGLVGFIGAAGMTLIMLYLPFLQIQIAVENRFSGIVRLRTIRQLFRYAPWAFSLSLLALCVLCIPLYLLRIEATPAELLWAPSLVFVLFMLPAKLLMGAAMGYARRRQARGQSARHWMLRWPARLIGFASVLIYVGALYVAQLVAGQGALVMYFQHAFLVPAPLIST